MVISIHAPRAGCDAHCHKTAAIGAKFQSTHPVRGATRCCNLCPAHGDNFNPRTPCGVRRIWSFFEILISNFNPRTPCGVRLAADNFVYILSMISIHAPRAGCDKNHAKLASYLIKISIHAPRAGCDRISAYHYVSKNISIHAPRAGCDRHAPSIGDTVFRFQSTHPVRGATRRSVVVSTTDPHFNPRTPCGVRLSSSALTAAAVIDFNPRTPCGVRLLQKIGGLPAHHFNPRTPCGVRRSHPAKCRKRSLISIHAPRAGCDARSAGITNAEAISIHAPRAGCDQLRGHKT